MATVSINGAVPMGRPRSRKQVLQHASKLAERFQRAAMTTGLSQETSSSAGIPTNTGPVVTHVEAGTDPYMMVRITPGQVIQDYLDQSKRLAQGLGVARIGISQRSYAFLRIDLDPIDPLACEIATPRPVINGLGELEFGGLENGRILRDSLQDTGHIAVQGQTRGGKSRWSYGLLGQLSGAQDIEVAGIDPTGKLLGPWMDHPQANEWMTCESDYESWLQVTKALVGDMRERIRAIPRNQDTLPLGGEFPLRLVVLEEWSNVLALAGVEKGKKGLDTELGKYVQILLAESHKAGYRLLMLAQRFDATVIGALNRDNISHRISFRTASKEGLKMLHEGIDEHTVASQTVAAPGIALIQSPSVPLQRMRAPSVTSYADYLATVDNTAGHGALIPAA